MDRDQQDCRVGSAGDPPPPPWLPPGSRGSRGNPERWVPDVLILHVCARGSAFLIRFPGGVAGVDVAGMGSTS